MTTRLVRLVGVVSEVNNEPPAPIDFAAGQKAGRIFTRLPGVLQKRIASYFFSPKEEIDKRYDRQSGVAFALTCDHALSLWRNSFFVAQQSALFKPEAQHKKAYFLDQDDLENFLMEKHPDRSFAALAETLQKRYPAVGHWHLEECTWDQERWKGILTLLAHCNQIKELVMNACKQSEKGIDLGLCPDLFQLIGSCKQLEFFSYAKGALSDEALLFLKGCPKMKELQLAEITDSGIHAIATGCAHLQRLTLWSLDHCKEPALLSLRKLRNLTFLSLVIPPEFSSVELQALSLANPRLTIHVQRRNLPGAQQENPQQQLTQNREMRFEFLSSLFARMRSQKTIAETDLQLLQETSPKYYQMYQAAVAYAASKQLSVAGVLFGYIEGHFIPRDRNYDAFQRLLEQAEIGINAPLGDMDRIQRVINASEMFLGISCGSGEFYQLSFTDRIRIFLLAQATLLQEMIDLHQQYGNHKGVEEASHLLQEKLEDLVKRNLSDRQRKKIAAAFPEFAPVKKQEKKE